MDFKVAGTEKGITALQLDVKTLSLTVNILEQAFKQARDARMAILGVMNKAISAPRPSVSKYAPKIKIIKIEQSRIGELIGAGGKVIKGIIARTGAQVDVDEEGNVFVSAIDSENVDKAVAEVEGIFRNPCYLISQTSGTLIVGIVIHKTDFEEQILERGNFRIGFYS